ncbi:helix-turn-helix domain-containing protein [Micromonospora sp. NBC_01813]|uniref:helix-turn-helix domain-containing protein n=1 Tax=Micromonospora sp. NBC_01813 TaxID=2975988 RepID=UPI002DDA72BC|nr:helix-turn-helix domain-containing protein [Micromonospora sp. NBC_01813]WSA10216.1 helix-turn-helix domain-containing protein [Micromonospora sp. NBC_01813]
MIVDIDPANDVSKFGRLIRQHRVRIGMTQRQLADFSTISVRAIRDLEQGKARRPRQDTVRLIAEALRLGPRARADLTSAASLGQLVFGPLPGHGDETPAPPIATDPLIARESELAALQSELASGGERLVHVVGLSGVGKTRLVLEVATRLHASDGMPVLWHAMADAVADHRRQMAEPLVEVVRAAVEDLFTGQGGGVAAFVDLVSEAPALLVIDGADGCSPRPERLELLLRGCPELRLIVTSDRAWGVPPERLFLLGPLELPHPSDIRDAGTLARVPAVRLFLDRMLQIRPRYTLSDADVPAVAEICRQVDGLPVALRAAASWLVVYELEVLYRCLDGDPEGLLGHAAGPDGGCGYRDDLMRHLDRLPAGDRELLGALCEFGGEFELDDVVTLTGLPLPDAGRRVRSLLLHGVVRPWYEAGRCRFEVLNLVLACHFTAPVPATCRS